MSDSTANYRPAPAPVPRLARLRRGIAVLVVAMAAGVLAACAADPVAPQRRADTMPPRASRDTVDSSSTVRDSTDVRVNGGVMIYW